MFSIVSQQWELLPRGVCQPDGIRLKHILRLLQDIPQKDFIAAMFVAPLAACASRVFFDPPLESLLA